MRRRRALAVVLLAAALGCARPVPVSFEPVRISRIAAEGDAARRASLRLCAEGLESDRARQTASARSRYERAMQIDPTNPWAYLVLARHELESGAPERALAYVQQAEALLRNEGGVSRNAEPHLLGLRGAALVAGGRDGAAYLERAAKLAPGVWGDGRLDAAELL